MGFWMPYFNIGLGISPAFLGGILMVLRGWDAFVDPVMGNLSDNARTRWGRRRPFIAVGAVATAIIFLWIWRLPPDLSDGWKAVYLIAVGVAYFTGYSCWSMPYYSLQLEMTPNYDERTRLTAWMTLINKCTALLGGWAMALVTSSLFANRATGHADIVHGVRSCSWIFATLILLAGLLPALFVKERYYQSETSRQPREPLWQSLKESAGCKPLWQLIGISFLLVLGSGIGGVLAQYLNIYYVNGGNLSGASIIGGWISSATFITGILMLPFWTWMAEKFDKKIVLGMLLAGNLVGQAISFACLQPGRPYLQMIPAMFNSMSISAVWLLLPSMKGDVADYDELHNARRREGSLNAFYSWFLKVGGTLAAGVGGLALQLSGFSAALPTQAPEVLLRMKWLYVSLPILVWSFTLIFIWCYPLNRSAMAEIRSELERRRGKV